MGEDKEVQNLWGTLLKESSKRFKAPEATCVFLGDTDIGKSVLLKKMGGSSSFESDGSIGNGGNGGSGRIIKDILSYAFIDVDEGMLDSEQVARINLWSINNKTFEGCLENVIKAAKSERLLFMIGVDVSNPDTCIEAIKGWLTKVRKFASQRQQVARGITVGTCAAVKWSDLDLPIIIVACKSDLLKIDDAASLKRARTIQGQLRAIALLINAAVVYVSSVTDVNTVRLRKYVINKLYPEALNVEGGVEDGMATAFIPVGADSAELIRITTGVTVSPTGEEAAALLNAPVVNSGEEDSSPEAPPNLSGFDLESEADWLGGLQSFISEVTSTGAVAAPVAAAVEAVGEAPARPAPRRSFRAPVAAQEKQDVDDFFQKLLIGGGSAPVAKK